MRNIVWICVDQLRADVAFHELYPFVQTPHLDRLRSESITFSQAFCNYPVCAPSRASMLTGRYPQQIGVLNNRCILPPDERTLGHHLADLGYEAVAFGKTHGQNPGWQRFPEPPIAESLGASQWGFFRGQSMLDAQTEPGRNLEPVMGVFDDDIVQHYDFILSQQVDQFLAARDDTRPAALWIGFHTPHPPLYPPRAFSGSYMPDQIELPHVPPDEAETKPIMQQLPGKEWQQITDTVRRQMIAAYLDLVTHVDAALGQLIEVLKRHRFYEDAVFVFLSDHGEQLGRHNMVGKFNNFYEDSLRVPLVIRCPEGLHAGEQAPQLVELVDVYPTICDLAGISTPHSVCGQSLVPIMGAARAHRPFVNCTLVDKGASAVTAPHSGADFTCGQMVRTHRWKLASYSSGEGELYDLEHDPHEVHNRFDDPALAPLKAELLQHMVSHMLKYRRDATLWGANMFPG